MPQFGRLDNNIYYMQGYSGHGVTCTHLAGRLISELLRGDAERFDAFAKLPHYPFPAGAACVFRLPPWARLTTACAIGSACNPRPTVPAVGYFSSPLCGGNRCWK